MKTKNYIALICMIAVLFSSCGKNKGITVKVDNFSNGKAAEVIVIMDPQFWNDSLSSIITHSLTKSQAGLNQNEPLFDLLKFRNSDFTSHFQRHRNIVRFDIDPNYAGNVLNIERNTFSSPQIYAHFRGNSTDSLVHLFIIHEQEILEALYENDLKRLQNIYDKDMDADIAKLIRERFGVTLSIPSHYMIGRVEDDFVWLLRRTSRNDRCIFISKTPAFELNDESVMNFRDEMTKKYIPGAIQGSYPIIARKFGFPIIFPNTISNRYGLEMRGIWESVNDNMGGPFYNFTFLNSENGNIISIDGFVYAPEEEKRDYLREVEAIVKSVR